MRKKKKLFIGISAPNSVDLLIGQLRYMKEHDYDVYLLAPADPRVTEYCLREGVPHLPVAIERNISPWKDLKTLVYLIRLFWREKPDIINLGTPKMSLVGMLAGFLTGVPYRIYTCRGFRFEHETGSLKKMLIQLEKVTAWSAHRVYCISKSVRDLGVELNIFPLRKTRLIAQGSSNGVDMTLFNPEIIRRERVTELRNQYDLQGKTVFGFVGRIVDRKGIKEMYEAFDALYKENPDVRLLVVGRPFWDQIRDRTVIQRMEEHPGIIMAGFQVIEMIPYFLSVTDIFLLPAHWEGFGNVLIQAAAMGVPIIATHVTGCKDAVSDGFNGVLVPLGQHTRLVHEMNRFVNDPELRTTMGKNGIRWSKNFEPEIIWRGYQALYEETV
jgi:glycosyltransferase involved in cell wall biosynthesis